MPCGWIKLPSGGVAHVKYGNRPQVKCQSCGRNPHTRLCDFALPNGNTCDAKLCAACSRMIGDQDFCPKHSGGGIMGLYNFQKRFVPMILSGEKTHTIRDFRKYPDKPGKTLHLYTGLRQKGAKLLMRVPCVRVEEIEIIDGAFGDENHARITVSGQILDRSEREALARRDGFSNFADMIKFWDGKLPFEGQIIHWRKS